MGRLEIKSARNPKKIIAQKRVCARARAAPLPRLRCAVRAGTDVCNSQALAFDQISLPSPTAPSRFQGAIVGFVVSARPNALRRNQQPEAWQRAMSREALRPVAPMWLLQERPGLRSGPRGVLCDSAASCRPQFHATFRDHQGDDSCRFARPVLPLRS